MAESNHLLTALELSELMVTGQPMQAHRSGAVSVVGVLNMGMGNVMLGFYFSTTKSDKWPHRLRTQVAIHRDGHYTITVSRALPTPGIEPATRESVAETQLSKAWRELATQISKDPTTL